MQPSDSLTKYCSLVAIFFLFKIGLRHDADREEGPRDRDGKTLQYTRSSVASASTYAAHWPKNSTKSAFW